MVSVAVAPSLVTAAPANRQASVVISFGVDPNLKIGRAEVKKL
jgi:hypothetical protein